MLNSVPLRLEQGRIRQGVMGSHPNWGFNGAFRVMGPTATALLIVASTAEFPEACGWEHVSISTKKRCPNWIEMCFIKDLFWGPEECVVQFHPPKSQYVNNHPFTLHLWKNTLAEWALPPPILVGVKGVENLTRKQSADLRAHMNDGKVINAALQEAVAKTERTSNG